MDNKIENKKQDEIEATSQDDQQLRILSSVPTAQNLLQKSLFTGLRPPLYPLHPGSYPYSLLSPSEMSQFSPWWVRKKSFLLLLQFPWFAKRKFSEEKWLLITGSDIQFGAKKLPKFTVFENHQKCRIWSLKFWHFPPIFDLLKLTCLITLFDRKL